MKCRNHYPYLLIPILGMVFFLSICGGNGEKVTFYEEPNREGRWIEFTIYGTGCKDVPEDWNERISSVNTQGNCILVWEHAACSGRTTRIEPGSPYHNYLSPMGFDNEISSFQLCSGSGSASKPNPETPRPPPPSDGATTTITGPRRVAVDEHNAYRRRHRSPEVRGDDDELHQTAQRHAEYLANNDKFELSDDNKYGENLAGTGGNSKEEAVKNAVRMWYNEESKYDYNNPGYQRGTGSFTAVVWKSTTYVGIGVAWNSKRNWWIVVANYNPPGNYYGQFRENVLPPSQLVERLVLSSNHTMI